MLTNSKTWIAAGAKLITFRETYKAKNIPDGERKTFRFEAKGYIKRKFQARFYQTSSALHIKIRGEPSPDTKLGGEFKWKCFIVSAKGEEVCATEEQCGRIGSFDEINQYSKIQDAFLENIPIFGPLFLVCEIRMAVNEKDTILTDVCDIKRTISYVKDGTTYTVQDLLDVTLEDPKKPQEYCHQPDLSKLVDRMDICNTTIQTFAATYQENLTKLTNESIRQQDQISKMMNTIENMSLDIAKLIDNASRSAQTQTKEPINPNDSFKVMDAFEVTTNHQLDESKLRDATDNNSSYTINSNESSYHQDAFELIDAAEGIITTSYLAKPCEFSNHRQDESKLIDATATKTSNQTKTSESSHQDDASILLPVDRLANETLSQKLILAIRSDMCSAKAGEEKKEDLEDKNAIRAVLNFINTGKSSHIDKMMVNLVGVAVKYDFKNLKIICESVLLERNLSVESVIHTLILADRLGVQPLKKQSIQFIIENISVIAMTAEWVNLNSNYPHLVIEIFSINSSE